MATQFVNIGIIKLMPGGWGILRRIQSYPSHPGYKATGVFRAWPGDESMRPEALKF